MTDGLAYAQRLLKTIRTRQQGVVETLTSGPVPDYAAYVKLRAKYEELQALELELRDLLKRNSEEDE